uniref:Uncharacterized protein n=1 Tax=Molossus molossus TaxID=27622 RepID=A0A7J8CS01_MOLMO|nr:hypothetical protein HJG59_009744 [Molossus molossus]
MGGGKEAPGPWEAGLLSLLSRSLGIREKELRDVQCPVLLGKRPEIADYIVHTSVLGSFFFVPENIFPLIFRERGREEGRGGERHTSMVERHIVWLPPACALTGAGMEPAIQVPILSPASGFPHTRELVERPIPRCYRGEAQGERKKTDLQVKTGKRAASSHLYQYLEELKWHSGRSAVFWDGNTSTD